MGQAHSFLILKRKALEVLENGYGSYYGPTIPISVTIRIFRNPKKRTIDLTEIGFWFSELFRGRLWFSKPRVVRLAAEVVPAKREVEWIEVVIERTDL